MNDGFLKTQGRFGDTIEAAADVKPPPTLQQRTPPAPSADKVTKMTMNHPPKIAWFSGTEAKAEDVAYDLWRHEVKVLMTQNYDSDAIVNAVRRSLRG